MTGTCEVFGMRLPLRVSGVLTDDLTGEAFVAIYLSDSVGIAVASPAEAQELIRAVRQAGRLLAAHEREEAER